MLRQLPMVSLVSLSLFGSPLKPGMSAPAFEAPDQSGRTIRLADFRGSRNVVLYFYPKDFTPGCTTEACSLRDGYEAILATGAVVLGVSADDQASHAAFSQKYNLPFSLLADPGLKIIEAYGVKVPIIGIAKRWTFVIDKQGVIRTIIDDVDTQKHDQQVLTALKGMAGGG